MVEERVKVDRKRFEQMLNDNTDYGSDADSFFRKVMESTNTQIMWPPKLKPGTKSKKDPHVRITGSPHSIIAAKEIIFEQLDTRRNRVTLKMDVAFTDHSHIIGKGGRSIQRVMDETGCHIHFPDSNRTNMAEKSNQVSIAGTAIGVEQSRCRIRDMLPITLQFDLPLNNGQHSPPTLDPQSPQLQAIQQNYGITIAFRYDDSKSNNNSYFASSGIITVAVRGTRSHITGLRQGLSVLIEYLTGFSANSINVPLTMTIDVAVQHHSFIMGRSNNNIRAIMQSTGAVITMPDPVVSASNGLGAAAAAVAAAASASTGVAPGVSASGSSCHNNQHNSNQNPNNNDNNNGGGLSNHHHQQQQHSTTTSRFGSQQASAANQFQYGQQSSGPGSIPVGNNVTGCSSGSYLSGRKTAISIRGPNFESVYSAWQELLGHLPLILIFDLKEGQELDAVQVTQLMDQMRQITILIKPKQRQNTKSIVVRGSEKDSRLLFEVRKQILDLDDNEVPLCCDQHAFKRGKLSSSVLLPQCSYPQSLQPPPPPQSGSVTPNQSPNPMVFQALIAQQLKQLAPGSMLPMLKSLEKRLVIPPSQHQPLPQHQQIHHHHHHHQQPSWNSNITNNNSSLDQQQARIQNNNNMSELNYDELRLRASKATLTSTKPSPDKPANVTTPPGLGFSRSMSETMMNQKSMDLGRGGAVNHHSLEAGDLSIWKQAMGTSSSVNDIKHSLSDNLTNLVDRRYSSGSSSQAQTSTGNSTNGSLRMELQRQLSTASSSSWLYATDQNNNNNSSNNNNNNTTNSNNNNQHNNPGILSKHDNTNYSASTSNIPDLIPQGSSWCSQQLLQSKLDQEYDYEKFRLRAAKAMMAKPTADKPRMPTPFWAGLGFSRSMSESMMSHKLSSPTGSPSSIWKQGPLFQSNILDDKSRRLSYPENINCKAADAPAYLSLTEFLSRIGLVQYSGLFTQHGIDLGTLFNLTETDLADLGLPFVHRRKLMIAICEIKNIMGEDRLNSSTFDAAPGAERNRRNQD